MESDVTQRRMYFIVNPKAGGGRANTWWEANLPLISNSGWDFFWEYTWGSGTANGQVRRAVLEQGAQLVIVVGGDGTLSEVVNGLIEDDRPIRDDLALAVFPAGSACDFSRSIYSNGFDLRTMIEQAQVRPIDIGRCELRGMGGEKRTLYYINSLDAGAGADTCVAVNSDGGFIKRMLRGKAAFMLSALAVLATFKYTTATVETDAGTFGGQYIIIGVGNGRYCGGGMMLFPAADLSDGKLDLLLIGKRSFLRVLQVFSKVYDGSIVNIDDVVVKQVEWVRLHTQRAIAVETDGEVPGYTQAEITVLPGCLPLLMPR